MGPFFTLLCCLRKRCHPTIYRDCAKHIVKHLIVLGDCRGLFHENCPPCQSMAAIDFYVNYCSHSCPLAFTRAYKHCLQTNVSPERYVTCHNAIPLTFSMWIDCYTWTFIKPFLDHGKVWTPHLHEVVTHMLADDSKLQLCSQILRHEYTMSILRKECDPSTHDAPTCALLRDINPDYRCHKRLKPDPL